MKYECLSKAVGESVRESVAFRDSSENEYDKDLNLYFMHKKVYINVLFLQNVQMQIMFALSFIMLFLSKGTNFEVPYIYC